MVLLLSIYIEFIKNFLVTDKSEFGKSTDISYKLACHHISYGIVILPILYRMLKRTVNMWSVYISHKSYKELFYVKGTEQRPA